MCGYRIWGLAAGFIGYFLALAAINFLGLDVDVETKSQIGCVVGFGIYLIPLIISGLVSNAAKRNK